MRRAVLPLLLLVSACQSEMGYRDLALVGDPVAPAGHYDGIAVWEGEIVVGHGGDTLAGIADTLTSIDLASGETEPFDLVELEDCRFTDYQRPALLPDGRLGALRECRPSRPGGGQLVAVDIRTDQVDVLLELPRPISLFTWTDDLQKAVVRSGSSLCGGLAVVSIAGEIEPMDMEVTGDGGAFHMADAWESASGAECTPVGWAHWPALRPDGQLAFVASTRAAGISGHDRATAPAALYVADLDARTVSPTLSDLVEPRALAWSPDGRWLAFSAEVGGTPGTWLLEPDAMTLIRVSDVKAGWLAWQLDGGALIALLFNEDDPLSFDAEPVRFDLPGDLIQPASAD